MSAIEYIYAAAACIAAVSLAVLAGMRVYDELRFRRGEKYAQEVGSVVLPSGFVRVKRESRPAGSATRRAKDWLEARTGGKGGSGE